MANFGIPRDEPGRVAEFERAVDDLSDAAYRLGVCRLARRPHPAHAILYREKAWFDAHVVAWRESHLGPLARVGDQLLSGCAIKDRGSSKGLLAR